MNTKDRWDAQYYKKHSAGQYKTGIAFIDKQEWKGGESVLDVGCGDWDKVKFYRAFFSSTPIFFKNVSSCETTIKAPL